MSLQIWLPLNGTLENQGLSNIEATNVGATSDANGKIGSCYYFNGTTSRIGFPEITINYPISICAWIKGETITASGTEYILSYNTPTGGTSGHAIGFGTYTGKLSIWHGGTVHSYGTALTNNIWYHVAAVVTESSYGLYLDGNLVLSGSGTQTAVNSKCITIGARSNNSGGGIAGAAYFFKGYMNDVRIYGHALSEKEVKELAKGLVLHYKLDDRYVEGTTNLVTTADALSSTVYNGATGKYGYGTNTDIYKTVTTFQGHAGTKVYMGTSGMSARPYPYFANLYVSNGTNSPAYKTISFYYYGTIGTYLQFYKLGNGTATGTWRNTTLDLSGSATNTIPITVVPYRWNHVELTLHGTTDADAQFGYCILGATHTSNTSNFWFFSNVQIETKDHATPYAGVGGTRAQGPVFDCSGYRYDGSSTSDLVADADTPRYSASILFNGSKYISRESISSEVRTISFWVKWSSIPSGQSVIYVDYASKTGCGLMYTGILCSSRSLNSKTFSKSGIAANVWYHFVIVCPNGSADAARQLYINGVEQTATSNTSNWAFAINELQIGKRSTTSDGFSGRISDFRMYSTVLSAEDILELYHTSASVDKSGNVYARELVEV